MQFSYRYLTRQTAGTTLVEFPDVPGATTEAKADEDIDQMARDCLVAALGGYIARRRRPPSPTLKSGMPSITLDLVTSAKLALASAMADQGVRNTELAERLGVTEKVVRRMLDPDHRCRIDRLEDALNALGLQPELRVSAA